MSTSIATLRMLARWEIDLSHSSVRFTVKHLNLSTVQGRFERWDGAISVDDAGLERSYASVRIEAGSVDTNDAQRDAHLRSPDFFDARHYPEITFRSTRIERTTADAFQMAGDLTIAGVTRTIALDVRLIARARDPWGAERAVFSACTTIDRRDFGLVWNPAMEARGMRIGEKVKIEISIEAVRHPQPDVFAASRTERAAGAGR